MEGGGGVYVPAPPGPNKRALLHTPSNPPRVMSSVRSVWGKIQKNKKEGRNARREDNDAVSLMKYIHQEEGPRGIWVDSVGQTWDLHQTAGLCSDAFIKWDRGCYLGVYNCVSFLFVPDWGPGVPFGRVHHRLVLNRKSM